MKKISILLLSSILISGANAGVTVKGQMTQKVTVTNGAIVNSAVGVGSKATQNIASNKGNVELL